MAAAVFAVVAALKAAVPLASPTPPAVAAETSATAPRGSPAAAAKPWRSATPMLLVPMLAGGTHQGTANKSSMEGASPMADCGDGKGAGEGEASSGAPEFEGEAARKPKGSAINVGMAERLAEGVGRALDDVEAERLAEREG